MPERIQRRRVAGWRLPPCTICVSRPARFGNRFSVTREPYMARTPWLVCDLHADDPLDDIDVFWFADEADARKKAVCLFANNLPPAELEAARNMLVGSNLACWCPPPPPGIADRDWCHAGWLLEAVNRPLKCEAA